MFRDAVSQQDKDLVFYVRDLVNNFIVPKAVSYDAGGNDSFDWSAIALLAEHNLLAPTISPRYGGRGISVLTTAMILEEIAAGSAGVATAAATNLHAISPIALAGTEKQRMEYLPRLTSSQPALGALAMIEHGSNLDIMTQGFEKLDISGSSVKAEHLDSGQAVLNGEKEYVMNAAVAEFITALVQFPVDNAAPHTGLAIVTLPMQYPGLSLGNIRKKLGLRYCNTSEVIFRQVTIEPEHLVGDPGKGFQLFKECLQQSVPYIGAIGVGIARAAYQHALQTSKERMISGRPVFEESNVSNALVDMASKLNAARLSVHRACWLIDQGRDCSLSSSRAKIISSTVAQEITARAMEIVGGKAYVRGSQAENYLRDAKMLSIVDGSEHFHRCLLTSQL